jgi:hypothetical protein
MGGGEVMSQVVRRIFWAGIVMLGMWYGVDAVGQVMGPPAPEVNVPRPQRERTAEDAMTPEQRAALAKKQNEVRQQDLKKDTDKLLELATELKQYVDKTNENILSMDVVKKAEQIEKLAKQVKDKMKGS